VLKTVSAVSGVYDLVVGAALFLFTAQMAAAFGVEPPVPEIFAKLNGIFLMVIGAGYYLPWQEPDRYRAYLWLMGPALKGAGAAMFIADYFLNGSPRSFLLFAASDGALALWTLAALRRRSAGAPSRRNP
jgi:hypothetical protein